MAAAELKAKLGMDDSEFTRVIRKSVNTAKTAGGQMSGAFSGIGASLSGYLTTGAIIGIGRKIFDDASSLQDMSDALNISTDSLQQYSFAFSQAGGSQESFVKGLTAINGKIEEARDGNDKTIDTFQKLGVSIEEIKDPTFTGEKALLRFADALKQSGSSADQLAAFGDIVGSKIQNKMVPALKNGANSFLALGKSAKIMSSDVISALDDAKDAQEKFVKDAENMFVSGVAGFAKYTAYLMGGNTSESDTDKEKQMKLNRERAAEKSRLRGVANPFDKVAQGSDVPKNDGASIGMIGLRNHAQMATHGESGGGNYIVGTSMLDQGAYKSSSDAYKTSPLAWGAVHRGDRARKKAADEQQAKDEKKKAEEDAKKADAQKLIDAINAPTWTKGTK